MIKFFRDVWLGAGYLEGYGHHPGNGMLLGFILFCGGLGLEKGGLSGFIGSSLIGAVGILPLWIIGCRDRARDYDRDVERTVELLKREF